MLEKFTLLMSVYRYGHHDIGFAVSFLQNESKVTIIYVQWIVCKRVRGIGYPQSIAIPIRAYTDTAYRLHQTWNNNIAPPVKWRVGVVDGWPPIIFNVNDFHAGVVPQKATISTPLNIAWPSI